MKKWASVLGVIVVAFAVWFILTKSKTAQPIASPEKIAVEDTVVASALTKQNPNTVAIIESNFARVQPAQVMPDTAAIVKIAPSGTPSPLQFTNFAPAIVLENMSRAIRQYGQMFGGNPVGTNPEITSQLNGNNPKHINFVNSGAGMSINASGELVDPWGTPFFFHQISGSDMEIRSAGPDKIMWTSDDLIIR